MVFRKKQQEERYELPDNTESEESTLPRAEDFSVNSDIKMVDLPDQGATLEIKKEEPKSDDVIQGNELKVTVVTTKQVFVGSTLIQSKSDTEEKLARLEL